MIDETDPGADSELRRRAAWLLGMLAIVAILFVVVMTTVLGSGGKSHNAVFPAPLDSLSASQPATPGSTAKSSAPASHRSSAAHSHARSTPTTHPPTTHGPASCPSQQPCAVAGDIGNAVGAINSYRTSHGQNSVPGSVSQAAVKCAVSNGGDCSGSWAESQVATASGEAAVRKIIEFGQLLDPRLRSFEVGWAYDPGAKQYYFAIVRND